MESAQYVPVYDNEEMISLCWSSCGVCLYLVRYDVAYVCVASQDKMADETQVESSAIPTENLAKSPENKDSAQQNTNSNSIQVSMTLTYCLESCIWFKTNIS